MARLGALLLLCALLAPPAVPTAAARHIDEFEKELLREQRAKRAEEKAAFEEEREADAEIAAKRKHEVERAHARRDARAKPRIGADDVKTDESVDTSDTSGSGDTD